MDDDSDRSNNRIYGPILPTELSRNTTNESTEYFGPKLPPQLQQQKSDEESENKKSLGEPDAAAAKKNDCEEEEEFNFVGPLPPGAGPSCAELEERALKIKIQGIEGSSKSLDEKSREEWMTELPDLDKSGLGMFARQFRKRAGPDMTDRSIWTDTPNAAKKKEKKLKEEEKAFEKTKFDHERDKEQEAMIKKHKKKHKRDKSLMEMHAKKLKKDKKKKDKEKKEEKVERRPFNREEDLQVNRFDLARKQALIKKAQQLDTRFSSGKSKYL